MIPWQTPSFEELAMNAEIGAYQPDDWDGERQYGNAGPETNTESFVEHTEAVVAA